MTTDPTFGRMKRIATVFVLGAVTFTFPYHAESQQGTSSQPAPEDKAVEAVVPTMPATPAGKATVMGGAIRQVDPVRDQFILHVSGGGSLKILFDERTQVFHDGVKTPLRDLKPADHASIETVLDGTNVFALSIHLLSQAPEGEIQGQVLSFNPETAELIVESRLSREPLRLHVPPNTPVIGIGQAAKSSGSSLSPSDVPKGALVSVKFQSDNTGLGVATEVGLLATPGSAYVLSGDLAGLDVHSGLLVVVDPRDGKSYSVSFDAAGIPEARNLREGMHVSVTASFDGSRYRATSITAH